MVDVILFGGDILRMGYRMNKPVVITLPFPKLVLPEYIIGGNHRSTSGRDSGLVLIPTQLVRQKDIVYLCNFLANTAGDAIRISHVLADLRATAVPL